MITLNSELLEKFSKIKLEDYTDESIIDFVDELMSSSFNINKMNYDDIFDRSILEILILIYIAYYANKYRLKKQSLKLNSNDIKTLLEVGSAKRLDQQTHNLMISTFRIHHSNYLTMLLDLLMLTDTKMNVPYNNRIMHSAKTILSHGMSIETIRESVEQVNDKIIYNKNVTNNLTKSEVKRFYRELISELFAHLMKGMKT